MQSSIELITDDPSDMADSSEILGSVVGMARPCSASLVHINMEAPSLRDVISTTGNVITSSGDVISSTDDAISSSGDVMITSDGITTATADLSSGSGPVMEYEDDGRLPSGGAPPHQSVSWQAGADAPVLVVRCKKMSGELVKARLGSGCKGRCIQSSKRWFTPTEFEQHCGRSASKDWKRSIKFRGSPLQRLIESGHLQVHTVACSCTVCIEDDRAAGPVKLQHPSKRRRKLPHQALSAVHPQAAQHQPIVHITAAQDDVAQPHTISLPANVLNQLALSVPNLELSGNTITLHDLTQNPAGQQVLPQNTVTQLPADAGTSLTPMISRVNTVMVPLSTIVSSTSPLQTTTRTIFTNSLSSQTSSRRNITLPIVQSGQLNNHPLAVPLANAAHPNTIVLPVVHSSDTLNINNPESIMLSNDTIELSLNPNEDDDDNSISLGVVSSQSSQFDHDSHRVTLQLPANGADSISIEDVNIGSDLPAQSASFDSSRVIKSGRVNGRGQIFSNSSSFTSNIIKAPNHIDVDVNAPRSRATLSSFLSSVCSTTNSNSYVTNLTTTKISEHQQRRDLNNDAKATTVSHMEKSFDRLEEVLCGLERGVSEARSLLSTIRGRQTRHSSPEGARLQAQLTDLLTVRRDTSDVSALLDEDGKEQPPAAASALVEASSSAALPQLNAVMDGIIKKCVNCGRYCSEECSGCATGYCGLFCQRKDWPSHLPQCTAPAPATQGYIYLHI